MRHLIEQNAIMTYARLIKKTKKKSTSSLEN